MKPIPMIFTLAALLTCSLPSLGAQAQAQAQSKSQSRSQSQSIPARITMLSGQVDLRSNANAVARPAQMSAPLAAHNIISTRPKAQAELTIGKLTVRLDAESELDISQLDAQHLKLALRNGSAFFTLADGAAANSIVAEVVTTQGRLPLQGPLQVRLDFAANPDASAIRLFSGNARFIANNSNNGGSSSNDGNQIVLQTDTQTVLRGGNISTTPLLPDEFDDWCLGASPRQQVRYDSRDGRDTRMVQSEVRGDSVSRAAPDSGWYEQPVYQTSPYPTQVVVQNVQTNYPGYSGWAYAPLYLGAWIWLNHAWYWDRGYWDRGHWDRGNWGRGHGDRGSWDRGHAGQPHVPVHVTGNSGHTRHR
jgi:hypothetical protein